MGKEQQKILVVDDERININVLVDLLKPNYKMMFAKTGPQALKAVQSEKPPDLVLLDIMMPDMDGYEVCQRIKANKNTRDIPIIFVTAMGEINDETKGLELGAVDYLSKPVSPPIVKARVKTHLALKQKHDDLAGLAQHLEHLNHEKNKILGVAAHDLRNPLSSVAGFSEILLSGDVGPVPDEHIEFLSIINSQARYMLNMVNDLLDVSVIESGKLELNLKTASLKSLAEERIRIHRISAQKKGMQFHKSLADIPDINFDSNRIAQVIDNLLSNSIKYSPAGALIHVELNQKDNIIYFSVQDEGPGIPEEEQFKLFGEFGRLSTMPTGGEKSTGLGLSIAKKIITAHDGKIWVESVAGKGSKFIFSLKTGTEND